MAKTKLKLKEAEMDHLKTMVKWLNHQLPINYHPLALFIGIWPSKRPFVLDLPSEKINKIGPRVVMVSTSIVLMEKFAQISTSKGSML